MTVGRPGRRRLELGFAPGMAALFSAFATASPAVASDGVLEINQTCAIVGCFSGDAPGFPVQIDGSAGTAYRLTSNLTVAGSAVSIPSAQPVDLDLNGFAIRGPGSCSGTGGSVACTGSVGTGIEASFFGNPNAQVRIRNGFVSGFVTAVNVPGGEGSVRLSDLHVASSQVGISSSSGLGFAFAPDLRIDGVSIRQVAGNCISYIARAVEVRKSRIADCKSLGLDVGFSALSMTDTTIDRVGQLGIFAGDNAMIRDVEVRGAGSTGIQCGRGCQVVRSKVVEGGERGIATGFIASIVDNVVDFNEGVAIQASDGSTIRGNSVGAANFVGSYPGISCSTGCNVLDNVVRNSSVPLNLGAQSSWRRNVLSEYPGAPMVGSGVSGGDNLCNGAGC